MTSLARIGLSLLLLLSCSDPATKAEQDLKDLITATTKGLETLDARLAQAGDARAAGDLLVQSGVLLGDYYKKFAEMNEGFKQKPQQAQTVNTNIKPLLVKFTETLARHTTVISEAGLKFGVEPDYISKSVEYTNLQ